MPNIKFLLVDDEALLVNRLSQIMAMSGFDVTTAISVAEALLHISTHPFDVLLSDLYVPGAGDGLTVVSAMGHANPTAVTMLLSAYPKMSVATMPSRSRRQVQVMARSIDRHVGRLGLL